MAVFATNIAMLGDTEVGKSSIVLQLCDHKFSEGIISTVGIQYCVKNLEIDGVKMKLKIWDTSGQERFRSIVPNYYRNVEGIVIVFDLTRRDSFKHVEDWIQDIKSYAKSNVLTLLLANKKDLVEARVVDAQVIESLAELHNIPYYEVSARTGENIEESITEFAKGIYNLKAELEKTEPSPPNVSSSPTKKHGCKC